MSRIRLADEILHVLLLVPSLGFSDCCQPFRTRPTYRFTKTQPRGRLVKAEGKKPMIPVGWVKLVLQHQPHDRWLSICSGLRIFTPLSTFASLKSASNPMDDSQA